MIPYRCSLQAKIASVLTCMLALSLLSSPAQAWNGKVVNVLSGDTFTATQKDKTQDIKLYGLDCPTTQTRLGKKAQAFTRAKIEGKFIKINPVTKDARNRIVALVSVDGQSLNAFLIRSGYALVNRKQCTASPCDEWIHFERYAHKRQKGIWSELVPQR